MTKEELEKEAYDYADKYWGASPCVIRALKETYITSAEPREKRIAELEKEIAELDCQKNRNKACYSCANATERCFKNEIGCPCEKYKSYKDENAELKEKVSYLEDNLRVARKDRENLQLDVAKGLKEFVKDYPATSLRYLANEKYIEQLTKAKELIEELSSSLSVVGECEEEECELLNQAEQFLKDSEVVK